MSKEYLSDERKFAIKFVDISFGIKQKKLQENSENPQDVKHKLNGVLLGAHELYQQEDQYDVRIDTWQIGLISMFLLSSDAKSLMAPDRESWTL